VWTPNTYTVTLNNDAKTSTITATTDKALSTLPTPTKDNYNFMGWYTKANGQGDKYTSETVYTAGTGITLYAYWLGADVAITYEGNGGSINTVTKNVKCGDSITIDKYTGTKAGYTFDGWNTKEDGKGDAYSADQAVTVTGSMTLYAMWKPVSYNVTLNNDEKTSTITATTGTALSVLPTPTKDNYNFMGWYTEKDGKGDKYTSETVYDAGADITLYAYWSGTDVAITYEGNGGSVNTVTKNVKCGDSITIDKYTGTKKGFSFDGWNTKEDGKGDAYSIDQAVTVTGSMTLYAMWKPASYTVTLNNDAKTSTITATTGTALSTLPTPTKDNYDFMGWYTEKDGKGDKYTSETVYNAGADITLYAYWSDANVYVDTMSPANGSTSVSTTTTALKISFNSDIKLATTGSTKDIVIYKKSDNSEVFRFNIHSQYVNIDKNNEKQLSINLPIQLSAGTSYYVTIKDGVILSDKGSFAGITDSTTWNFSTEAVKATVPVITGFNLKRVDGTTTPAFYKPFMSPIQTFSYYAAYPLPDSDGKVKFTVLSNPSVLPSGYSMKTSMDGIVSSTNYYEIPSNVAFGMVTVNIVKDSDGTIVDTSIINVFRGVATTSVEGTASAVVAASNQISQELCQAVSANTVTQLTDAGKTVNMQLVVDNDTTTKWTLETGQTVCPLDITLNMNVTDPISHITTRTGIPVANDKVTIRVAIPKNMLNAICYVIKHKLPSGGIELIYPTVITVNGVKYLEFQTDSFSPYAIVATKETTTNSGTTATSPNKAPTVSSTDTTPATDDTTNTPITTAVVKGGKFAGRQLPTFVTVDKDGKYSATVWNKEGLNYEFIYNVAEFSDVKNHWAKDDINELASRKVISGRTASTFAPDASITRAEFAAIVVRALGLMPQNKNIFTDVTSNEWYYGEVATAYAYGIISGRDSKTFDPSASITREEAMAMIARAAKVAGMDMEKTAEITGFTDANAISAYALDAAKFNIANGLFVGNNGSLLPKNKITRAEVAAVVLRMLQKANLVDSRVQG